MFIKLRNHSRDIEDFVETRVCKLCVVLRSCVLLWVRVLYGLKHMCVCMYKRFASRAVPSATLAHGELEWNGTDGPVRLLGANGRFMNAKSVKHAPSRKTTRTPRAVRTYPR